MKNFINLSFYVFFEPAGDLQKLRECCKKRCEELKVKGTILLAPEGINVFVAVQKAQLEAFKEFVAEIVGNQNIAYKESYSDYQPYNRMLVKVKNQIIAMHDKNINPTRESAPRISPQEFHHWLLNRKDMVVLDTRNAYEVRAGSFDQAKHLNIKNFTDFEHQLKNAPEEWKDKTIVSFCTGGIRCEKAAPLMMKHGFKNVYQLDGGILKYFEEVGGEFYHGDCFVFDKRVALNSKLEETDHVVCFACRGLVTPQEQKMSTYKYGEYCPHCYEKNHQKTNS